jgi:hypothetical protein
MIGNQSKLRLLTNGVYKDIGAITDIPVFQRTRGELKRTTYKDGTQKRMTIEEAGDLTITFNYLPKDDSQRIIEKLFDDNKTGNWEFYLNDDFGTTKRFDGALKNHSTATPNLGLVSTTITIAVSGNFKKLFSAVGLVNFINNTTSTITLPIRTLVTKTTSGVEYSYRTTKQITLAASKTIQGKVICLNAGTTGNTPIGVVLANSIEGIHTTTNTELTGGGDAFTDNTTPDIIDPDPTPVDPTPPATPDPDPNQPLPGVTVSVTQLTINEDTTATYNIFLNTEPTGDVTIIAFNRNADGVIATTMVLTFTPANFATPQNISVYGRKDTNTTNQTTTIMHRSSGADYDGLSVASVTVTII